MSETVITWTPAFVPVANDRDPTASRVRGWGTVRGALVTVSRAGVEHVDTIVPPLLAPEFAATEGSLLCWVGPGLLGDTEADKRPDADIVDALAHAANEGAAGRSGSRTLGGAAIDWAPVDIETVLPSAPGGLYAVPNELAETITQKLDEALANAPADAEKDRDYFRDMLLRYFVEYGELPDFTISKKAAEGDLLGGTE